MMDHVNDIDWNQIELELEKAIDSVASFDVTVEVIGSWLWLTGNTPTYTQNLREAGFQWSKEKSQWFYRPKHMPYKKSERVISLEKIRDLYGSRKLDLSHS